MMGDRANIRIKQLFPPTPEGEEPQFVYLYTHWGGTELPQTLAKALDSKAGRSRWDDESYLARIIFCHMLAEGNGLNTDDVTGFGISCSPPDNEHPYLDVDCLAQTVNSQKFEDFIQAQKVAT